MKHTALIIIHVLLCSILSAQNPVADFEVNVIYNCGSAKTEFVNKSQNAEKYLWDDNETGVFHEIFEPRGSNIGIDKSWIVTLVAFGNGTSDTVSKQVDVFHTRVNFEYSNIDTMNFAPLNVEFLNESALRDGDTLEYEWEFGDGYYSEDKNPIHTFEIPETYCISLKGIKNGDCELHANAYIIVKDTAQKGEFDFIIGGCLSETESSQFDNSIKLELRNDSLIIWGLYSGNCGTKKTATIRYKGDTVVIKTWEVGLLATCSCNYCFEIGISNIYADFVNVIFNNQPYTASLTTVFDYQESYNLINVYPNPSDNKLKIDFQISDNKELTYEIIDLKGMIRQRGKLSSDGTIYLDDNLIGGLYILVLKDKFEIINQHRIIIK